MKKIIMKLFPTFFILLGIFVSSCNSENKKQKNIGSIQQNLTNILLENKNKNKNKNIDTMEIKIDVNPNVYNLKKNETVVNYRIQNKSTKIVQFASDFLIEKENNKHWTKEPLIETLGNEDIIFSLEPNQSKDFQIPLAKVLNNKNLSSGIYRISKKIWYVEQKKDVLFIFGEFEIK